MNLYTTKEFAEKVGVWQDTVEKWVRAGKLVPVKRIGTAMVFSERQVRQVNKLREPDPRLITVTELAKEVGISRQEFYRLRDKYGLEPVKTAGNKRGPVWYPRTLVAKLRKLRGKGHDRDASKG